MKTASRCEMPEPAAPDQMTAELPHAAEHSELPEGFWEPLPGTVSSQFIRCGKKGCHCVSGLPHGPYFYRIWREGIRVKKVYVKAADVSRVRFQCERHFILEQELKAVHLKLEALKVSIQRHRRRAAHLRSRALEDKASCEWVLREKQRRKRAADAANRAGKTEHWPRRAATESIVPAVS